MKKQQPHKMHINGLVKNKCIHSMTYKLYQKTKIENMLVLTFNNFIRYKEKKTCINIA